MAKKESIPKEVHRNLITRLARERSKHEDKKADKLLLQDKSRDKIESLQKYFFYSEKTLRDYENKAVQVCRWANEQAGHRLKFEEVGGYVRDYLTERRTRAEAGEITPRTLAKERAILSKVWLQNLDDFAILKCTAESEKGRERDKFWNPENHADACEFYSMVGARKHEYHNLTAEEYRHYAPKFRALTGHDPREDLHGRVSNIQPLYGEDGQIHHVVILHAKHGKTNISEIRPADRERLTEIFKSGDNYKYYNPSSHTNIHAQRREYAQRLYEYHKRDTRRLPERELYRCRDGSGRVYDRRAVSRVAVSLGHREGDLFDTIHNYLR